MRKLILIASLVLMGSTIFAQKKITTSATVSFDATTDMDAQAKAENKTVIGALNTATGVVQFEVNVKNFAFGNPTMQRHFNEARWLDSEQFPKMTFTGKITDLSKVNFKKDGTYKVSITGDLTVRGVTKPLTASATLIVIGELIQSSTEFSIKVADFGISGTQLESGKVSREPKIKVSAELK